MEDMGKCQPSEGERVLKAGEGLVHGLKARTDSGNSLPGGEGDRRRRWIEVTVQ
jgi:hypothetical protein